MNVARGEVLEWEQHQKAQMCLVSILGGRRHYRLSSLIDINP